MANKIYTWPNRLIDFLPEWAIGVSDGDYMQEGAQLCTKDGRKMGNAYVDSVDGDIATVVTDMGNIVKLNRSELEELFYPPRWIVNVEEKRKRIAKGIGEVP